MRRPELAVAVLLTCCLMAASGRAADNWVDVTSPLLDQLKADGKPIAYPGGCSGVVVDRLTGDVTIKVVGRGLYRSTDQGTTWQAVAGNPISGRDETGWGTSLDADDPRHLASFSLDGTAGCTVDGTHWRRFSDLGRNWDYGSVDWSGPDATTIIAAKHETTPAGEVYVSTDGCAHWRKLDILLGGDRRACAMVGALAPNTLIYANGHGIQRSTDTGATWTTVSPANPLTRIPVRFHGAHYLGTADGLLVSRDLGATWQPQGAAVSIRLGPFFGADEQAMMVVGDGGAYHSTDGGAHWTKVCGLRPDDSGFSFGTSWFGCYAWDPVHDALYASAMGHPVYRLALK